MPPLNEGDILYMPTAVAGMSVTEATQVLQIQDRMIRKLPRCNLDSAKPGKAASRAQLCHASQGRLATHIHDLLTEPLKTLVVNRFIRKHVGRGFELDRSEFLKSAPEFHAFARPRTGEIEQKEKPGA
jgi:hypothetical protein